MKNTIMILFILICSIFMQGCFNQGEMIMNKFNLYEENKNSDYPYAWVLEETDKAYIVKRKEIKGEIIKNTIVPTGGLLENDVFKAIKNTCGYKPSDRVQIRKLSYDTVLEEFKEIWVFKDNKSEMEDKITALTVIMKNNKEIGGVDIATIGQCPAKRLGIYTPKW